MLSLTVQEIHKFLASFRLIECPTEIACRGNSPLFLDTAHLHAHVLCLYYDHNAERMQGVLDAILYLQVETLLHL